MLGIYCAALVPASLQGSLTTPTRPPSRALASVRSLEFFQDSGNPGYFLIKIALVLMALIVILQALLDIIRPREPENP